MPKLYKVSVNESLSKKIYTKSEAKKVVQKYEAKKIKAETVFVCDAVVHSLENDGSIGFFQCTEWNTDDFSISDRINKQER